MRENTHTPPTCSIIIPVFNNYFYTRMCLQALRQHRAAGPSFEVIIIDNGSTDNTSALLSEFAGDLGQVVRNPTNRGFAVASNQGARCARGEFIVFLNNDVVVEHGWLEAMVAAARFDPSIGGVGARLLYPDGTIQHAGVVFGPDHHPHHAFLGYPGDWPDALRSREYQAVTGACMLVKRKLFEVVGGFDESYLNAFEDTDLCLKIRQSGQRLLYCAEAVGYHFESPTPGRFFRNDENCAQFLERWADVIIPDSDPTDAPSPAAKSPASQMRVEFEDLARRLRTASAQNVHLQRLLSDHPLHALYPAVRQSAKNAATAELDLIYSPSPPSPAVAGTTLSTSVVIINCGTRRWPAGTLRLSYHWRHPGESDYLIRDGLRTDIEEPLEPGGAMVLEARVSIPQTPCCHILEWDAVEENVAWLSQRGVVPYTQRVQVIEPSGAAAMIKGMPTQLRAGQALVVTAHFDGIRQNAPGTPPILGCGWVPLGGEGREESVEPLPAGQGCHRALKPGPCTFSVVAPCRAGQYRLQIFEARSGAPWIPLKTGGSEVQVLDANEDGDPSEQRDSPSPQGRESGASISPLDLDGVDRRWLAEEIEYHRARLGNVLDREQRNALSLESRLNREHQKSALLQSQLDGTCREIGALRGQLDQVHQEAATFQSRYDDARHETEVLQSQLAETSDANAALRRDLNRCQQNIAELFSVIDGYRTGRLMRVLAFLHHLRHALPNG